MSNVEKFIQSADYTDKRRNGIGVTAGIWHGEQRVTVGKAWVKIQDEAGNAVSPENLFVHGAISLSPSQAESLADELREAAIRARALVVPPKTSKKSAAEEIGAKILAALGGAVTSEQIDAVLAGIQTRVTPDANYRKFADSANQVNFDRTVLPNKDMLTLFDDLIASKVEPVEALNMVLNAVS